MSEWPSNHDRSRFRCGCARCVEDRLYERRQERAEEVRDAGRRVVKASLAKRQAEQEHWNSPPITSLGARDQAREEWAEAVDDLAALLVLRTGEEGS